MDRFHFLDIDTLTTEPLNGLKIGVLGYGNQGRTHALNLRDSGFQVVVGQRQGRGFQQALADGFDPMPLAEASQAGTVLMLSLPDVSLGAIFDSEIAPALKPGQTLLVAHGFAVVYELLRAPEFVDVALVAPKGAGAGMRTLYEEGGGVPCLVAVAQDASGLALDRAYAYALGIGCGRSGLIAQTTLRDETQTDLFGEQAVLCGGIPSLMQTAYEVMVARGYPPEMAYFECIHEAKLVVDLIARRGIAGMRGAISDTAAWGGMIAGPAIINAETRARMEQTLDAIESGQFAAEWVSEVQCGKHKFQKLAAEEAKHLNESTGLALRRSMGLTD